jgi:GNAT superfamily N-acetyltransferase
VVDESRRGQGIGSQLIDAAIQEYSGEEISGQVSSLASLKVLFNKGFRPYGGTEHRFREAR